MLRRARGIAEDGLRPPSSLDQRWAGRAAAEAFAGAAGMKSREIDQCRRGSMFLDSAEKKRAGASAEKSRTCTRMKSGVLPKR